jgi:hypothetical protein
MNLQTVPPVDPPFGVLKNLFEFGLIYKID